MSEDPLLDPTPNINNFDKNPPQKPEETPCSDQINFTDSKKLSLKETLRLSLTMGLISFGGPVAHIGLFHKIFITDHSLISEKAFTELFALCNIIPGPTSSQLLTSIFLLNSGSILIGIYSFLCFNMPALLVLFLLAFIIDEINPKIIETLSVGIRQAAVAVILQAALTLSKKILNSRFQIILAASSFLIFLFFNNYIVMLLIMISCAGAALIYRKDFDKYSINMKESSFEAFKSLKFLGFPSFLVFLAVYLFIYFLTFHDEDSILTFKLMESFYRMGSLVIGGGHVIIPMIFSEFIHTNLLTETQVLDSFALVSLMPGPMFNLAGYLGFKLAGLFAGLLSAICIFLPGLLLLFTGLGFMGFINKSRGLQMAIRGVSSAAIGFIFVAVVMMWVEMMMGVKKNGGMGEFLEGAYKSILVGIYLLLLEKFKFHVLIVFLISLLVSIFIQ